jgi:hypothetical protein
LFKPKSVIDVLKATCRNLNIKKARNWKGVFLTLCINVKESAAGKFLASKFL